MSNFGAHAFLFSAANLKKIKPPAAGSDLAFASEAIPQHRVD